jgi:hypothetical protein
VEEWHPTSSDHDSWDAAALHCAAAARIIAAQHSIDHIDRGRFDRISSSPFRGSFSPADCDAPNLLVAWASGAHHDSGVHIASHDALVALRRMFGLPICDPATNISDPRSCLRCGAVALSSRGVADVAGGRPRAGVDVFGEHALTCAVAGGGTQRRHNEVANAIRECVDAAGWRASTRGGPVFTSHGGRPADVWVASHPLHRGGQALDCTIVTTSGRPPGRAAAMAEDAKEKKYRAEVVRHDGLGFAPLGFDLMGGVGPAAWAEMQSWARAISRLPSASRDYGDAVLWVTSVIASAFVSAVTRQIRLFDVVQRRRPFDVARRRVRR